MGLLKRKRAKPVYVKSVEEQEFDKMFDDLLKAGATKPKPVDPIEAAADDVLIFELIKRGYAVAKMPAEELAKAAE